MDYSFDGIAATLNLIADDTNNIDTYIKNINHELFLLLVLMYIFLLCWTWKEFRIAFWIVLGISWWPLGVVISCVWLYRKYWKNRDNKTAN